MKKKSIYIQHKQTKIQNYYFFISLGIFLLFGVISNAQEPIWAKAVYGSMEVSGSCYEYGVDTDIDSNGNIFIIGWGTGSTLHINNTSCVSNGNGGDAFIAKFSSSRELLWFKTFGGFDDGYHDEALDIHIDNNNDVIILAKSSGPDFTYNGDTLSGIDSPGQYSGEGVIIKVNNDGDYLWHDHGSVSSSFQSVTTDSSRNLYLTGWFTHDITLGGLINLNNPSNGSTTDMFVAKYSFDGEIIWAKNVGGVAYNSRAFGHNIAFDQISNKVVVIGRFQDDIFFETGMLSYAGYSTFIVSYNSDGTELWKIHAFNDGNSYCQGLDISPSGLIGVAGANSLGQNPSGLIGFYNLNGDVLSEEVYYSTEYCHLHSLEFNQLDECFITGGFDDSHNGFILKLNNNLNLSWSRLLPASFENKITCKYNRIFYSGRIDVPFIYDYGTKTIINNAGDAIFAEISDTSCPVGLGTDIQTACHSYIWIDGNTYTSNNNTATYHIVGGTVNGCDSIVTLNLTIINEIATKPQTPIGDNSICFDGELTTYKTNATIGNNVQWFLFPSESGEIVLSNKDSCQILWNNAWRGVSKLYVTANNSCGSSNSDTLYINIGRLPILNIGNETTLCEKDSLELNAGSNFTSYKWQDNSTDSIFIAKEGGQYYVESSHYCGVVSDTINITEILLPKINLPDDTMFCIGSQIDIDITLEGNNQYTWQDGSNNPFYIIDKEGVYTASIKSYTNCSNEKSVIVKEVLFPYLNLPTDTIICNDNKSLILDAFCQDCLYKWHDNDTLSEYSVLESGEYIVTVYNFCDTLINATSVEMIDCNSYLDVPSAFSPNEDGINDVLYAIGKNVENINFIIFDRWGEKIFQSTDLSIGWNGAYKGNKLESDVFMYYISASSTSDGSLLEKKGSITLVN